MMSRRALSLLTGFGLVAALLAPAAGAAPGPVPEDRRRLTYDDFARGHLRYPAVQRAHEFVARQEALGTRAAPGAEAGYDGDYGHKGCTPPAEYQVGDTREFWVSQQQTGTQQITGVLAAKSKHGYIWVQQEYYAPLPLPGPPQGGIVTQAEAEAAAQDWESIFETDREYFGEEPNVGYKPANLAPGLPKDWRDADCDRHISILNFPIDYGTSVTSYVAGYYSSEHEYPNGPGENESPYSNETEMFFMNSLFLDVGGDTYNGVLAHEFFHMIQFSNDYNEETWVNEGVADIAAAVNGFEDIVQGHIDSFEEDPDNHLFDWGSQLADYGQAFLFFDYLFSHYGSPEKPETEFQEAYDLAQLLTKTEEDGAEGITATLKGRSEGALRKIASYYGKKAKFMKVFKDWSIANFVDDTDLKAGQFGYTTRNVQVAGTGTGDSASSNVHPYAGDYYKVTGDGRLTSEVDDPVAVIPAQNGQPAPENGYFAWSNRADEMLTFLERKADLTDATAPQLQFAYWYQIEEDWDYTYVRVSTDGGKTYDYLTTTACGGRSTDPNGNNRATAQSGGITGNSGGWKECTLSLEQYVGEDVLVRFEYDTDQAVTEPGYVVDNVKLIDGDQKVWKTEKFEDPDTKFNFGGDGIKEWLRLQPLANNKPLVQILRITGDTAKRKVLKRKRFEPGGERGLVLKKAQKISGDQSIIVFSSTTPIATTPFGYTYNITR